MAAADASAGREPRDLSRPGWLFAGLCFAALVACLSRGGPLVVRFFNADTLFLPALYQDLFADGGRWRDWQLPAAPFFFPDMALYFLLLRAFRLFEAASLVYAFAQYGLLLWALRAVFAILFGTGRRPDSVLFGGGILLLLVTTGHFDFFVFPLLPNYHMSALLFGLVGFLLLHRYETRPRALDGVLLLAGTALLSASDRLVLVNFVLPACGYVVFLGRFRHPWRLAGALVAAAAVGVAFYYAEASGLHSQGLAPADRAQGSLDFARFPATFAEAPMLPVAIALALVFHVLLLVQRRRLDSRAVLFFLASHLAVVVGTLVLARKGDSLLHQRFFVVVWIFGLLGLWPLAGALGAGRRLRAVRGLSRRAAAAAALVPLGCAGYFLGAAPGGEVQGFRLYPQIARCVDRIAAERGDRGLAILGGYWFTRLLQLTTRQDVHAVSVTGRLQPTTLAQGRRARERVEARGGYDALLLWKRPMWRPRELAALPKPDSVSVCRGVPHPKFGRPRLDRVKIGVFERAEAIPWRRSQGSP